MRAEPPSLSFVRSFDGARISYRTLGAGPGILLVHGGVSSSNDLLPLARSLGAELTVHLIDRRGRGRSDPQGPDYSLETEYRDAAAILEATGSDCLFGHSFGALVALGTAPMAAVKKLVLYDPPLFIRPIVERLLPGYRAAVAAGRYLDAYAAVVDALGVLHGIPTDAFVEHLRREVEPSDAWPEITRLLVAGERELAVGSRAPTGAHAYRSVLAETLLLIGGDSPAHIQRSADFLMTALPNVTRVPLVGQGHTAALERPAEMARIVARFCRAPRD
jgi:pimeloyl-ACP methyl ester carboxylesterase